MVSKRWCSSRVQYRLYLMSMLLIQKTWREGESSKMRFYNYKNIVHMSQIFLFYNFCYEINVFAINYILFYKQKMRNLSVWFYVDKHIKSSLLYIFILNILEPKYRHVYYSSKFTRYWHVWKDRIHIYILVFITIVFLQNITQLTK